jgi:formylglycine-generating enzyme required for sulfatase activity
MTPTAKTYRYDAFLSYRHQDPDRAFTLNLLARLESKGLKVAIDQRDFVPNETFLEEMERCIRESRFTLAVLSPSYLESGNTQEEAIISKVLDMSERRRRLIPLILVPVERPVWLYNIVGVDFSDPNALVEPFERLLATLTLEAAETPPAPFAGSRLPAPIDPRNDLTRALEDRYHQEEELLSRGGDATAVRAEILDIRRHLREGGRLHPGDFLANGRFKLIEPLGKGGFATVWKAFDKRERNLVAIKVLHGQWADDRTRLERFFRGARKMATLQHPGIVRVLEPRMDEGGFHFFVMEFVEGGDLREAVLAKRLAPERIVPLIQEAAAALQCAHEQSVVHRDVKPANILLDHEGRPKLTDFDLVRAADTTGGTMVGGMLGTFLYTAPEAMSNPQEADVPADIYSLAMTVAFCFLGTDLPVEVLRDVAAFVRKLPCPAGVQEVLRKAAAWEPEARFASVIEFSQALEEGLHAPARAASWAPKPRFTSVFMEPRRGISGFPAGREARGGGASLQSLLQEALAMGGEAERSSAVLLAVEESLSLAREDAKSVGLTAWALDYAPGRAAIFGRVAAQDLRDRLLAPFRKLATPPRVSASDSDWASIPDGSFEMGSASGGDRDEHPVHRVTLSSFRILVHSVTNREYRRFSTIWPGDDDLPAVGIDWFTAYAYAAWLGGRLPTEAEWEYAARAGCPHAYCDSNGKSTQLDKVGWYAGNSGEKVHPVAQLEPNPWGLYDLVGNVWEWVGDWYAPYSAETQSDPCGPPTGDWRVLRGGSCWNDANRARAAYRNRKSPGVEDENLGFRVVLPAGPKVGELI